ncbi:hypothetical protein BGZ76_009827 [Entomortierella beljakovae]|nr:hypothetical protein BGZ76_009827 [Entomortierella beljakovae]
MKESLIPEPSSDVSKLEKCLLRKLLLALHPQIDRDRHCPPDFRQLKKMVWTLLLDTPERTESYTTLQIVNQILHWIELGMFAPPTSEHVFVSAWSLLFNTLLLDTNIRAIPGELISKASTSARQRTETTYGSTTMTPCGRKVDMSIHIHVDNHWKSEIAIFEFKTSTASPGNPDWLPARRLLRNQQKKSVRLNAAILLDIERQGLNVSQSYPIIAEGQALGLSFYTLRRYEDILDAGKATARGISLPSQVEHLKAFLESDAILTLLAFKVMNDLVSDIVFRSPPPPKKRVRPFVVFSPSKRDKKGSQCQNDSECFDDECP